jgi:methyltransferase
MRRWLVGLVCLERVIELALSRRNASRLRARGAVERGRRHTRLIIGFHTAVLAGSALEPKRQLPRPLIAGAFLLLASAQVLRYAAIATLGDRWSIRVLALPDEPPVTNGPYRWIRHPNYLGVLLEMTALPTVCGAPWTAAVATVLHPILLAIRIAEEERALGAAYQAAFAMRPRLLPRRRSNVTSGSARAG